MTMQIVLHQWVDHNREQTKGSPATVLRGTLFEQINRGYLFRKLVSI